mgnify:CR=1 FL=1
MSSQTIDILNKILQGEQMAIDLYEIFLSKIDNNYLNQQLGSIQKEHYKHQHILMERITELGGRPQKTVKGLLVSKMTELIARAKTTIYTDYVDILKDLANGQLMGIDKTQQIIYDRLEKADLAMVRCILSQEIEHIRKLKMLAAELEQQRIH